MSTSSQPEQPIPPALQTLRDRIDQIDHQFMDLLAERHRVVGEVAAVKRETGIPIRDDGREAALLADRRSVADRSGLNPEVTESLFRLVLWASRNRQAQLHAAVPQDLTSQRVAVIGAEGGMGTMMSGLLQDLGNEVLTVDRNTTLTIEQAAASADVVLVSVDIRETEEVIRRAGPHLCEDSLFTDVTSTKHDPVAAMLASSTASVIGTHPLFGPGVHSLQGQRIAITPGRLVDGTDWMTWLTSTLRAAGLTLLETTPEDHDRVMAVVQVLTHFSTEVIGRTMEHLDVSIEETLRFTSPIYHLELLMTARHFAQSPNLYSAIQMSNPNTKEVATAFRAAAAEFDALVQSGDAAAFREAFGEVSAFFGDFAETALAESTHLIDRLVERS
ncbi:MAG: bifunctional chorismate mutase/prephenate dehydrogenase [Phycisphaerales bacterium]|mgnify:FL=1|jgi:chorismate mutase/prephenate dehydrogenase|nr:bifunctional chorismate mutase/prephenate dehydrogenase [Planctomycetaceae bacterium]MDP6158298.1 bifunctional chorismate mutase/prephenate dehydrogenase [Phycisphaerales bacterium]MDP6310601.1 bifunctional chorismate mutase/prephenate dehydrogenase [Phycisphaerales bacterium]MDP7087387.1 bifunctional chorismate mutase/prephenate dehydrogenase [Phycisphaerales bacterium]MDP7189200.1 bifunctional chorismate mutase/prephenate dehydrogenase [Phycisphaerales bacterium]|tara:strand:- start:2281 stop:3444 length:1164 start_codon:yes stop_codon:yes gene_type:complete